MPRYDFICDICDQAQEVYIPIKDDTVADCPDCKVRMTLMFTPNNNSIIFKGYFPGKEAAMKDPKQYHNDYISSKFDNDAYIEKADRRAAQNKLEEKQWETACKKVTDKMTPEQIKDRLTEKRPAGGE